jgi:hypothetical protein
VSDDGGRLRTTIHQLVREQNEHLVWLRRIEEKLRAARDSMLVYRPDTDR